MGSVIVTICIVFFLVLAVCSFMWKLSKWLLIPLRIIIFLVLVLIVLRVLATRKNVQAIYHQVEQSPIPGIVTAAGKSIYPANNTRNADAKTDVCEPIVPKEEIPVQPDASVVSVKNTDTAVEAVRTPPDSSPMQKTEPSVVPDVEMSPKPKSETPQSVFEKFEKMNMTL